MKAPSKPQKPSKPVPPNKAQKVHKHSVDIEHLFFNTTYYDDDGNEITEEEYDAGNEDGESYSYEKEEIELTPSIKSIMACIPSDCTTEDALIELSLGYDSGRNYDCRPYEKISIIYTTPFDYDEEFKKYEQELVKYEKKLVAYDKMLILFKKENAKYKEEKEKARLAKKKSDLEAELALLNGKI